MVSNQGNRSGKSIMKKIDQAKRNENYARAEIERLESVFGLEEAESVPSLVYAIQAQHSVLAQALYEQARLAEAREAAEKGLPGWKEDYIRHIKGVEAALERRDAPLCLCREALPLYQRYSLQDFNGIKLLQCPICKQSFALAVLPEELAKISSGRIDLAKNDDVRRSIPDETI